MSAPKKTMLIDATHPEETRVVVLSGDRLGEFDVEVASRKQLKGNIYLAKVTRVEPSLQAAFVDYGGNRHGFLAFNEIHPDYYQIPVADREALIAAQNAAETAEKTEEDGKNGEGTEGQGPSIETLGGDDSEEVEVRRRLPSFRQYRIQEVIKPRQILLVQVVKEERGTKGAALTTYLSLAGRYCVLMPNTARGGGISRKINNQGDRKRLKTIVGDLDIPQGMGVIVRTAGAERTKTEIKRDFEYLLRLWDEVRELTLKSIAPAVVYEEANLIKRTIRDVYTRDIEEIIVDGEAGYLAARNFMKLLMPSHAKRVKLWPTESVPLFQHYQVESQLDAMHSPHVQLRSGGYIVISPTEALVSIDVNSGRATRERNIEETALRTNLEAAEEIARQLRLRDLAGLIVIDFIDMEHQRNQTQVERRLKEAMRHDRARIQIGRISPFGLLELSRQRLRPSLFETSFETCPYCAGTGVRRSTDSAALHILRAIADEGIHRRSSQVTVHVPPAVAIYLLNRKRATLAEIEKRYAFTVGFATDDTLIPPQYRIERLKPAAGEPREKRGEPQEKREAAEARSEAPEATRPEGGPTAPDGEAADGGRRRRRRRRGRRRRDGEEAPGVELPLAAPEPIRAESVEMADIEPAPEEDDEREPMTAERPAAGEEEQGAGGDGTSDGRRRRRRGRRGGRRRRREGAQPGGAQEFGGVEPAAQSREPESGQPATEPTAGFGWPSADTAPSDAGGTQPSPFAAPISADQDAGHPSPAPWRRAEPSAAPPEPRPIETPEAAPEPAAAPPAATPEAAKTTVIDVDESAERAASRRGWWKRLTS